MSSPIERLPVELLDLIIVEFLLEDLQNVRLVSNRLHHAAFTLFRTRYFATRTTTLASPSLDRLFKLSKHKAFASQVSTLTVRILNQEEMTLLRDVNRIGMYPPPKRFPAITFVSQKDIPGEAALWDRLFKEGASKETINSLGRALARFTNLHTVHFYANGQRPNGQLHQKEAWGPPEYVVTVAFRIVVSALIQSQLKISNFITSHGIYRRSRQQHLANLSCRALEFPDDRYLHTTGVFEKLSVLTLSIRPDVQAGVANFINNMPNLSELTLCYQIRGFFLRSKPEMQYTTQIDLPKLSVFRVWGGVFLAEDMRKFMKKHAASLRAVEMRRCYLRNGTWTQLIDTLRQLRLDSIYLHKLVQCAAPPHDFFQLLVWPGIRRRDGTAKPNLVLNTLKKGEKRTMHDVLTACVVNEMFATRLSDG